MNEPKIAKVEFRDPIRLKITSESGLVCEVETDLLVFEHSVDRIEDVFGTTVAHIQRGHRIQLGGKVLSVDLGGTKG